MYVINSIAWQYSFTIQALFVSFVPLNVCTIIFYVIGVCWILCCISFSLVGRYIIIYCILQALKNNIFLKREDTQPVFSFKIRGAYNKMAHLTRAELDMGVVACSAGNHAQGVAFSARKLGCHAVIVMPLATPSIKVNAVRTHGGPTVEVRLFGNNYDEAATEAKRLQKEENMTMIHPFDDPYVIAGQGTIGTVCVLH
jgi:threonine synthase